MICKSCAEMADNQFSGSTHFLEKPPTDDFVGSLIWVVREEAGGACKGGTHCDCQHKEPGTAINKEVLRDDAG